MIGVASSCEIEVEVEGEVEGELEVEVEQVEVESSPWMSSPCNSAIISQITFVIVDRE